MWLWIAVTVYMLQFLVALIYIEGEIRWCGTKWEALGLLSLLLPGVGIAYALLSGIAWFYLLPRNEKIRWEIANGKRL